MSSKRTLWPLRVIDMANFRTEAVAQPWQHFPHCHERLWATTFYRHRQDPRGLLELPTEDGRCPHCDHQLYAVPSPESDAMANMIKSMR
jgi:hypothetical protein